jgi:hypothetical protein
VCIANSFVAANHEDYHAWHLLQVVTKLHRLLKPFMLRRMKADVEICLPRKQEILLYAPMTEEQQKINRQLLDKTLGVSLRSLVLFSGRRVLWEGTDCLTVVHLKAVSSSMHCCSRAWFMACF